MRDSSLGAPQRGGIPWSSTRNAVLAALAVVVVAAFALRVAVYYQQPRAIDGAGLTLDQGEMARNIVDHGKWFVVNDEAFEALRKKQNAEQRLIDPSKFDYTRFDTKPKFEPEVHQMPGLAPILAGFWWVTGDHSYSPLIWLQLVLDTAMCVVIYWLARRLRAKPPTALLAAAVYAVWPGAIIMAKRPLLDTWSTFFSIACVALFVYARDRPRRLGPLVALGVVAGVGIYFRPFVLLIPIALALVATPKVDRRWRVAWLTVPTVAALVVLSPWTIRNAYEFHKFIPTRTGLGEAAFEGLGQAKTDTDVAQYVQKKKPGVAKRSPDSDTFLLRRVFHVIARDPGAYAVTIGKRAIYLLPCLLAVLLWRRRRTEALMLVAVAAAIVVPYLFIGRDTRFYLPASFVYCILGAIAAERILAFTRRRTELSPHRDEVRAETITP